ncbi:hypothetical protein A2U01_0109696, partial [Trifolium medium]|nr:hypothetical protein [Trifolium medium]
MMAAPPLWGGSSLRSGFWCATVVLGVAVWQRRDA